MVDVTAPATLKEGYKFTAVYQEVNFSVIVVSLQKEFFVNVLIKKSTFKASLWYLSLEISSQREAVLKGNG